MEYGFMSQGRRWAYKFFNFFSVSRLMMTFFLSAGLQAGRIHVVSKPDVLPVRCDIHVPCRSLSVRDRWLITLFTWNYFMVSKKGVGDMGDCMGPHLYCIDNHINLLACSSNFMRNNLRGILCCVPFLENVGAKNTITTKFNKRLLLTFTAQSPLYYIRELRADLKPAVQQHSSLERQDGRQATQC
ncbi:uncharacterized protein BDR25DRAFT_352516 [Lindgomyces ingoldianus]|uniref:Uncharacterized protein n=1 Tax=Lindgomyces ingoldianus TaxID=673940 RepID=A0ACB6R1B8_9PLEO|nr:uncharacterized protein BDR25DRAFT_352516 [Lindgomyces ingoldianus]KAF2473038.1 hypothetical protein BDR25DRAFT_352516 [Lindgomyces ingoldianus]